MNGFWVLTIRSPCALDVSLSAKDIITSHIDHSGFHGVPFHYTEASMYYFSYLFSQIGFEELNQAIQMKVSVGAVRNHGLKRRQHHFWNEMSSLIAILAQYIPPFILK